MAHTKKGSKAPGYEYWSRRPYNHGPSKRAKRICHRMERRIAQREVLRELHDL